MTMGVIKTIFVCCFVYKILEKVWDIHIYVGLGAIQDSILNRKLQEEYNFCALGQVKLKCFEIEIIYQVAWASVVPA